MAKRFTLEFEDLNGQISIKTKNDGFNGFELAGLLYHKLSDIREQIDGHIKPDKIERTAMCDAPSESDYSD